MAAFVWILIDDVLASGAGFLTSGAGDGAGGGVMEPFGLVL